MEKKQLNVYSCLSNKRVYMLKFLVFSPTDSRLLGVTYHYTEKHLGKPCYLIPYTFLSYTCLSSRQE